MEGTQTQTSTKDENSNEEMVEKHHVSSIDKMDDADQSIGSENQIMKNDADFSLTHHQSDHLKDISNGKLYFLLVYVFVHVLIFCLVYGIQTVDGGDQKDGKVECKETNQKVLEAKVTDESGNVTEEKDIIVSCQFLSIISTFAFNNMLAPIAY